MKQLFTHLSVKQIFALLSALFLLTLTVNAQEYKISFSASGASGTLENVVIENVSTGLSVNLNGTDTLVLNSTGTISGINLIKENNHSKLTLFPNPVINESTLSFDLPQTGNTTVSITDITGKIINKITAHQQSGSCRYTLPVLKSGLYIISVQGKGFNGFEKLLSISNVISSTGIIQQISTESPAKTTSSSSPNKIPAAGTKKALKYTVGDLLRFTGTTGNASTIIMDNITISKNIDFHLINCIDGDNNIYPAIKIGPLYWMAKNLKTRKYNSGVGLNFINSQLNWNALTATSESYCYYNDIADNADIYGALYTYNAAATVAPEGWRLPTEAEFNELAKYLGGLDIAGAKMKAMGTKYWTTPNTSATNASGFNALASGYRTSTGFSQSGTAAAYWTSTKVDQANAYNALLLYNNASIKINNQNKLNDGLSIRCVYQPNDNRVEMLKSLFGSNADPKPPVVGLDTLPIKKTAFIMPADKELMFMIPSATNQFKLNYNPSKAAITDIPNIPAVTSTGVKWWLNLKKMATQLNSNGHENTIMAVWNESKQGFSSGTGKVTLHIIGDSVSNYAHQTIVLPDDFTMPDIHAGGMEARTGYNGIGRHGENTIAEYCQQELTLKTGDVNNDGTPDILLGVHDILRIYDGKTYAKIAERSFQSDHSLTPEKVFYLCFAVTDIDKNGRNDILVTTSSNLSNLVPKLHVFINGNLATTDANLHLIKDVNPANLTAKAASFAIGDINGDGLDEIVFHLTANTLLQYVTYFNYSNKSFTALAPLFQVDANYLATGPIILARLKGPAAPYYIVTSNCVVGINDAGNLSFPFTGSGAMIGGGTGYQVFGDQMVAGNFDKDITGTEEVCYIHTVWNNNTVDSNCWLNYMYINSSSTVVTVSSPTIFRANHSSVNLYSIFPVIAGVNTSHTGKILEFKRHEYMLTSPVVNAVLATAPYYPSWYTGTNSPSTSWGKSTSTGSGSETEITHTATAIMGFEQEFNIPLVATKIGGVEFTAKVSTELSSAFSTEKTVTKSVSYQSGEEDAVVVSATPYDAYFYTILKSDKPEQEGSEFMISFPRKPITQMISVDSYNKFTEGQNVPIIDKSILKHTVGLPLTYPTSTTGLSNLTGNASFVYTGSGFTGVGNTGGVSKEIEVSESQSKSTAMTIEAEAELVFTAGGVKLGAGYGYSNTNSSTTTIGQSTTVSGYVPGLNPNAPAEFKKFNWNLVWYNYRAANQTFSIVNFLVQTQ